MQRDVRCVHQFLTEQRFYAVVIFCATACTLLFGRYVGSGSRTFAFLLWNLTLAFIPYALSFVAAALDRSTFRQSRAAGVVLVALALPWLAFLPNAPYLVTDLLHLRTATAVPVWYDVTLFASFAYVGCLLGVASLHTMRGLLAKRIGEVPSHVAALAAVALSALGIYLGRVVRLNSWDLLVRPQRVLLDIAHAARLREAWIFVALFGGFLFVGYLATSFPAAPRPRSSREDGERVG